MSEPPAFLLTRGLVYDFGCVPRLTGKVVLHSAVDFGGPRGQAGEGAGYGELDPHAVLDRYDLQVLRYIERAMEVIVHHTKQVN